MADENDSGEVESAERSIELWLKRRISNTLKKIQGTIEQFAENLLFVVM